MRNDIWWWKQQAIKDLNSLEVGVTFGLHASNFEIYLLSVHSDMLQP